MSNRVAIFKQILYVIFFLPMSGQFGSVDVQSPSAAQVLETESLL